MNDSTSENNNTEESENYLTISEWGIRLTIPDTITDVRYKIVDNKAYFIAKPVGLNVEFAANIDSNFVEYSRVYLLRSTEKNEQYNSEKVGNYYFVIFGPFGNEDEAIGLFGDESNIHYENRAFTGIQEMLFNTIQPLQ
jgi:hypothetical protein